METDREAPQRTRLLLAMASAVAAKGYAAVTIADVVAGAGVSKRTFYEHFSGKEDCLFSCYSDASDALAAVVREAAAQTGSGPLRVVAAIQAYFLALDASGPFVAAMLTEIQATGAAGRDLRRQKAHEFAALIRELVADDAAAGNCAPLDEPVSLALVGGLYELGLSHAETSPDLPFSSLAPAAERYILAILRPDPTNPDAASLHPADPDPAATTTPADAAINAAAAVSTSDAASNAPAVVPTPETATGATATGATATGATATGATAAERSTAAERATTVRARGSAGASVAVPLQHS